MTSRRGFSPLAVPCAGMMGAPASASPGSARRHFNHGTLLRFDQTVVAVYLTTQRIYVIQDNWPVHFHPALLVTLAETPMDEVTQTVWAWLDQWIAPAPDLPLFVGLLCPSLSDLAPVSWSQRSVRAYTPRRDRG